MLANIQMTITELNIPNYDLTCNMNAIELKKFIFKLENSINSILEVNEDFEKTLKVILDKLASNGHKLFSLDYDNDTNRKHETWGMNYTDTGVNGLEIDFWKPGRTKVIWVISNNKNENFD
jgi:hypothetical protein